MRCVGAILLGEIAQSEAKGEEEEDERNERGVGGFFLSFRVSFSNTKGMDMAQRRGGNTVVCTRFRLWPVDDGGTADLRRVGWI